jgi:hypothetical protein
MDGQDLRQEPPGREAKREEEALVTYFAVNVLNKAVGAFGSQIIFSFVRPGEAKLRPARGCPNSPMAAARLSRPQWETGDKNTASRENSG